MPRMIPQKQQKQVKKLNEIAKYSSMAFQMVFIIAFGVFGGIKIDKWLHLKFPLFTVILSFLAVLMAIYYFIKDVSFISRKNNETENN